MIVSPTARRSVLVSKRPLVLRPRRRLQLPRLLELWWRRKLLQRR